MCYLYPRKPRKNAFTLIELLVVVSIIIVLIALLLPALGKAKERVILVKCRANMRSTMTAINMYASYNDGWYPMSTTTEYCAYQDSSNVAGRPSPYATWGFPHAGAIWSNQGGKGFGLPQLYAPRLDGYANSLPPFDGINFVPYSGNKQLSLAYSNPDGNDQRRTTVCEAILRYGILTSKSLTWYAYSYGIPTGPYVTSGGGVSGNSGNGFKVPGKTQFITNDNLCSGPEMDNVNDPKPFRFALACTNFGGRSDTTIGRQYWGFLNGNSWGQVHGLPNPASGGGGVGGTVANIMHYDGSFGIVKYLPFPLKEVPE